MGYYYANTAGCYVVSILFAVLCTFLVAWRFYLRRYQKLALRLDDWLCIPALIFTLGSAITIILGTAQGAIGRNSSPQSIEDAESQFTDQAATLHKCGYALIILSYYSLGFIKLSFLFFYRHIFRGKAFDIASWATILVVTLWMILFSIIYIFSCGAHFDYIWGNLHEIQRCINVFDQNLAGSIIDVLLDVALLIMPLVMILKMSMPLRTTIAGCSVFLVASISIGAGVCRLVINASLENVNNLREHRYILGVPSSDLLELGSIQLFWTMIEMGVGLVAACLPCIGFFPLMHKVVSGLRRKLEAHLPADEESAQLHSRDRKRQTSTSPLFYSGSADEQLPHLAPRINEEAISTGQYHIIENSPHEGQSQREKHVMAELP